MISDSTSLVKKLSFPRYVGTEGELNAQNILENEFETKFPGKLQKDEFECSDFYMNYILRYFYNPICGLLILLIFFGILFQIYLLSFVLSMILLPISFFGREIRSYLQYRFDKFGRKYKSANYWIKINSKIENANKNVVLLAHYDSISFKFNPFFDGFIFLTALLGGTIVSIHFIISFLLFLSNVVILIDPLQYLYGLLIALICIIQVFNSRGNNSDGTLDNASGVGVLFDVMDQYKNTPLNNFNLYLVATGAEELGDWGAYYFIKRYKNELPVKDTYFFVIDSIGYNKNLFIHSQGVPKHQFSPTLEPLIREIITESNNKFDLYPQYIPPFIHFGTDHVPIKPHGYEFMIFGSQAPIHCPKDNYSNFNPGLYLKFSDFIKFLLTRLDSSSI